MKSKYSKSGKEIPVEQAIEGGIKILAGIFFSSSKKNIYQQLAGGKLIEEGLNLMDLDVKKMLDDSKRQPLKKLVEVKSKK